MLTHRPLPLVLCGQGCTDEIPWLQNNRRVRSDHNHQVTATTDHEGTWESQGATRRAIRRIWNTGWGEGVDMGGSEWDLSMSQGHTHPVQVRRLARQQDVYTTGYHHPKQRWDNLSGTSTRWDRKETSPCGKAWAGSCRENQGVLEGFGGVALETPRSNILILQCFWLVCK